jgi:hypothetical protein
MSSVQFVDGKYSWLGSTTVILVFFWMQVKIDQLAKDWAHSLLFMLSLFAEIYLIWLLNSHNV